MKHDITAHFYGVCFFLQVRFAYFYITLFNYSPPINQNYEGGERQEGGGRGSVSVPTDIKLFDDKS